MSRRLRILVPALCLGVMVLSLATGFGAIAVSQAGDAAAATGTLKPVRRVAKKHRLRPRPQPLGVRAARIALRAVGVRYRWGGTSLSGGFDCSGLVYWAYRRLGVSVPHNSYALYASGRTVSRKHLVPGDVLVFSGLGHVGLYVGGGRMVHAPETGRRVEIVRLRSSRYGQRLIAVRRFVPAT